MAMTGAAGAGGRVYLDWNATAPLRREAREAMVAALDLPGNPSSVHAEGRAARALVERSRRAVADAVGCAPGEVVFTSGATEAAAILGRFGPVAVDPGAHDALWGYRSESGTGDLPGTAEVLALGVANSETGVVAEAADRQGGLWRHGALRGERLLLDATQVIGRVPWSFAWSGAEIAVLSAHKLGGPKGVGAMIVRDGLAVPALLQGGGQEMGRRSGTENVAAIAGFAAAARAAMAELSAGVWDDVAERRDRLEARLVDGAPDTICVGRDRHRLPNTTCLLSPGWSGETQVMALDLAGFAVSAGSACSSGKVRASRTLLAMGYAPDEAGCAIRVSLGPATTDDAIERFADAWLALHAKHRRRAA